MKKKIVVWMSLFLILVLFASVEMNIGEGRAAEPVLNLHEKWTGDFDGMVDRHVIRALVPYSKTFYFFDKADQRGLTYETLKLFEKYVNHLRKKL